MGGAPNIPGRQEHTALLSTALQSALAPHGDGTHGVIVGGGGLTAKKCISLMLYHHVKTGPTLHTRKNLASNWIYIQKLLDRKYFYP